MIEIEVGYTAEFIKLYHKLTLELQEEIKQAIALFRNKINHRQLRVHKLHGRYAGKLAFYINYRYRIIFKYLDKHNKTVALLQVGDYDIYKK